jgi:hypothetical protein
VTRRSSPPRAGPPPSTRTSTGSQSPATRSAPASASLTSRLRAAAPTPRRREPAAGNLPRRLTRPPPRTGRRPGPQRAGRLPARCALQGALPCGRGVAVGGSTGTAKAWQPTGTGSSATGRPTRGQRPLARSAAGPPAAGAEGRRPGAQGCWDGQRNWQTVYPGSRTCHPSTSPANLLANTYSCRQWSAVVAVNAQDAAGLNLPVNSQTV